MHPASHVSCVTLVLVLAGCQHRISTWRDVARATGCTPELLARSAPYDSTHVRKLAGSYRLVQVDTAHGWVTSEVRYESPVAGRAMRLWLADSTVAHWRRNAFTGKLRPVDRPVVGEVPSYGEKGFTDMNPQVEIGGGRSAVLSIKYHVNLTLDGKSLWGFPIERVGRWGFGGYFFEPHDMVIPFGADGKLLPPRSGYYCAFRT